MLVIYDKFSNIIKYDKLTFSGGEEHIRFKSPPWGEAKIIAHLRSSQDVIELLMATDALRRAGAREIHLVCPYLPYARQDRVCNPGEALGLKVMCDLLNSQGYASVEIWDAHSDVSPALLNNCLNVFQTIWTSKIPKLGKNSFDVVVSPDAGADKKAFCTSQYHKVPLLTASKHRDTTTGEITNVSIDRMLHPFDTDYLIVDDICDGGRTYIEIAKALRHSFFKGKIHLYVTHGIFSKGLEVLKPYIDHVYTANIWPDRYKGHEDYVTILNKGGN